MVQAIFFWFLKKLRFLPDLIAHRAQGLWAWCAMRLVIFFKIKKNARTKTKVFLDCNGHFLSFLNCSEEIIISSEQLRKLKKCPLQSKNTFVLVLAFFFILKKITNLIAHHAQRPWARCAMRSGKKRNFFKNQKKIAWTKTKVFLDCNGHNLFRTVEKT